MNRKIYLLLAIALLLSGCTSWIRNDQVATGAEKYPLRADQPLGQTLTARHAGLRGIELYLEPHDPDAGELKLSLTADPNSSIKLISARLDVQEITQPGYYYFNFPSIADSQGKSYFIQLEIVGPGWIDVGVGPGDSYLDGAFYVNGQPEDAQLAFRTLYNPAWLGVSMARQGLNWLWVLLLSLWLFLIPGLALLIALFPKSSPLTWLEKAILGTGLGLAGYPILFLLTDLLGLRLGRIYAWSPPVLGAVYLIWKARSWLKENPSSQLRPWWRPADRIPELATVLAGGLLLASRFYPVAGLEAPMWGDSYQHSMITQLMFDNGGLFDSWQPYAEMTAFTYHFGFHSLAAVFGWVSGESSLRAVLWVGQIINLLAVMSLYPLALRLSKSRWGGLIAIVAAGALAPMPMAYINWGRYTQLAGQAVLPAAVYLAWRALESRQLDWRLTGLGWIAWAGLALTHYRVLIFGVIFILGYLIVRMWHPERQAVIRRLLALSIGAGALFLPWFLHIFVGRIIDMLISQLTTPPSSQSVWAQNNLFYFSNLERYLPIMIWVLAGISVVWALGRRKRDLSLIALWAALVLFAANPDWAGLPGEGALSNFAIFIAAYIPAALLIGGAVGDWLRMMTGGRESAIPSFARSENIEGNGKDPEARDEPDTARLGSETGYSIIMPENQRRSAWVRWVAAILILLVCTGGARDRIRDVDPFYGSMVTRPDMRAARWIEENIPLQARFHVNQFFAFSDSVTVGADAGWWLPLIAGRATDLPPINYGFEQTGRADYPAWVNALPALIVEKGIDHPEVLAAFQERGITHIYIGQRQGRVNYNGPEVLEPERLVASPSFIPLYNQDRVWIFEINP